MLLFEKGGLYPFILNIAGSFKIPLFFMIMFINMLVYLCCLYTVPLLLEQGQGNRIGQKKAGFEIGFLNKIKARYKENPASHDFPLCTDYPIIVRKMFWGPNMLTSEVLLQFHSKWCSVGMSYSNICCAVGVSFLSQKGAFGVRTFDLKTFINTSAVYYHHI